MEATRMQVNIQIFNTLSLSKVRKLLPPNYCIRQLDDTVIQGLQETGNYFVTSLHYFFPKKKQENTCTSARLTLFEVLDDGSTGDKSLECFIYGPFCKALEKNLVTEQAAQSVWSANRVEQDDKVVWVVLHRPFIRHYMGLLKGWHKFSILVGPETTPHCQMWLLFGRPPRKVVPAPQSVSKASILPPPLIDLTSPPAPQSVSKASILPPPLIDLTSPPPSPPSPSPSPATTITYDAQTSTSTSCTLLKKSSSSSQASPVYSRPTFSKTPATGQTPAPAQPRAPGPSCISHNIKIEYKLKPLSQAVPDRKMSTAGVVVEVLKKGQVTMNNFIFDIFKVADKGLTGPTFMIKVFHNDKMDWPEDSKPKRGQVMVFTDMMCKEYMGSMEGTVNTTKSVYICTCDEDFKLTWCSHSQKYPHNIENAEKVALELFYWWRKDRSAFRFRQHGKQLLCHSATTLPTRTISHVCGRGRFTLYCQVVKKTLYPSKSHSGVLRVCDGTRTSCQFEEITTNPNNEVEDRQLVFGVDGSLEVDILMMSNIIPPEVENLQVGSFVRLNGVKCHPLHNGCWKLIIIFDKPDNYMEVLRDDDQQLPPLKSAVQQARAEMAEAAAMCDDDGCLMDSEEMVGGDRLIVREIPASRCISPSLQPSLPNDCFEAFVKEQGWIKEPPGRDSPTAKKQQLNASSSSSLRPFISRPPLHPSSHQPFQQAPTHHPLCTPISTHYNALEEFQELRRIKERYSDSINKLMPAQVYPTRKLNFHTKVMGEAKETTLATFFAKAEVGEMHCVEATIMDFRTLATRECFCFRDGDHLCLHQWVWGLCRKCRSSFSSNQLCDYISPSIRKSQRMLQCSNCYHKHINHSNEAEDEGQPLAGNVEKQPKKEVSHYLPATVSPFIKIKVVVKDPTSDFQRTLWLTADNANFFFHVIPTFRWLMEEEEVEVQKVVEALLAQNCSLALGMMKKEVEGRVDVHIANTVLRTTKRKKKRNRRSNN